MTAAHNLPHEEIPTPGLLMQPVLGPMVYGDACDIRVGRRQCGSELGCREAIEVNGRTRILCAMHVEKYFPNHD
jgi:hypothetical protein